MPELDLESNLGQAKARPQLTPILASQMLKQPNVPVYTSQQVAQSLEMGRIEDAPILLIAHVHSHQTNTILYKYAHALLSHGQHNSHQSHQMYTNMPIFDGQTNQICPSSMANNYQPI